MHKSREPSLGRTVTTKKDKKELPQPERSWKSASAAERPSSDDDGMVKTFMQRLTRRSTGKYPTTAPTSRAGSGTASSSGTPKVVHPAGESRRTSSKFRWHKHLSKHIEHQRALSGGGRLPGADMLPTPFDSFSTLPSEGMDLQASTTRSSRLKYSSRSWRLAEPSDGSIERAAKSVLSDSDLMGRNKSQEEGVWSGGEDELKGEAGAIAGMAGDGDSSQVQHASPGFISRAVKGKGIPDPLAKDSFNKNTRRLLGNVTSGYLSDYIELESGAGSNANEKSPESTISRRPGWSGGSQSSNASYAMVRSRSGKSLPRTSVSSLVPTGLGGAAERTASCRDRATRAETRWTQSEIAALRDPNVLLNNKGVSTSLHIESSSGFQDYLLDSWEDENLSTAGANMSDHSYTAMFHRERAFCSRLGAGIRKLQGSLLILLRKSIVYLCDKCYSWERVEVQDAHANVTQSKAAGKMWIGYPCMLNPHSTLRSWIDTVVWCCCLYCLFEAPYSGAFLTTNSSIPNQVYLEHAMDVLFMVDLLLEFRTAKFVLKVDAYTTSVREVTEEYLTSHFLVDLLSSFPLELVVPRSFLSRNHVRLVKVLRVHRMRNFGRGGQVLSSSFSRLTSLILRIFRLLFQFLLLTHMIGCVGYMISTINHHLSVDEISFELNPWTYRSIEDAEDDDIDPESLYLRTFFYALSITTGIGNTPNPPRDDVSMSYICWVMMVGASFWGYAIGIMIDLIAAINKGSNEYDRKLDQLREWMEYKELPSNLRSLILRHFQYQWRRTRFIDEEAVMQCLSPAMQLRLRRHLCRHIVESMPMFKDTPSTFVDEIVNRLKAKFVTSGEVICHQGEVGNEMFLIAKGRVEVLRMDEYEMAAVEKSALQEEGALGQMPECVAVLEAGSFFGEIAMVFKLPRISTCRAMTQCDLFSLKREDFESVMTSFPDQLEQIAEVASQRAEITQGIKLDDPALLLASRQPAARSGRLSMPWEPSNRGPRDHSSSTNGAPTSQASNPATNKDQTAGTAPRPNSLAPVSVALNRSTMARGKKDQILRMLSEITDNLVQFQVPAKSDALLSHWESGSEKPFVANEVNTSEVVDSDGGQINEDQYAGPGWDTSPLSPEENNAR